jgi:hypothetical protein
VDGPIKIPLSLAGFPQIAEAAGVFQFLDLDADDSESSSSSDSLDPSRIDESNPDEFLSRDNRIPATKCLPS